MRQRGRGGDCALDCGAPEQLAVGGSQRVQRAVQFAEVEDTVGGNRRGPLQSCICRVGPEQLAGSGIQRVHPVIVGADIDEAVRYGGGEGHEPACAVAPDKIAAGGVEGVEVMVVRADVQHATGDGRCGFPSSSYGIAPEQLGEIVRGRRERRFIRRRHRFSAGQAGGVGTGGVGAAGHHRADGQAEQDGPERAEARQE